MNGASHRLVQVPPGVQCFVGAEARRRRRIEEAVISVFEGWDYEEIIPPLFDYADVFATPGLAARTYSFVGRDGSLLALRPDRIVIGLFWILGEGGAPERAVPNGARASGRG